jgi:hypothetical protein
LLRAEQPPGWWPVVAAALSSDGWNGAWTWLAVHDVPSAAPGIRHRGAADVTPPLPAPSGSFLAAQPMREADARHLARDRAGLLPKLRGE